MSIKILSFKITGLVPTNDLYGPIIKVSWEESRWFGLQKVVISREVTSDIRPHKDENGLDVWSWYFVEDGNVVPYRVGKALDETYRNAIADRAAMQRAKSLRPMSIAPPKEESKPEAVSPFPPAPSYRPEPGKLPESMHQHLRPPKGKL